MKADAAVKRCPPTRRLGHPSLPRGVSEEELTLVSPAAAPAGASGEERDRGAARRTPNPGMSLVLVPTCLFWLHHGVAPARAGSLPGAELHAQPISMPSTGFQQLGGIAKL